MAARVKRWTLKDWKPETAAIVGLRPRADVVEAPVTIGGVTPDGFTLDSWGLSLQWRYLNRSEHQRIASFLQRWLNQHLTETLVVTAGGRTGAAYLMRFETSIPPGNISVTLAGTGPLFDRRTRVATRLVKQHKAKLTPPTQKGVH